jgi:hypothetical protein
MIDLRSINRAQFVAAKRYWAAAIIVKLVIFGLGAWTIFLTTPSPYLPEFLLVLAILSEILQLRSDGVKSQAESLLRTLDICKSFGREISEADKRDIVANVPRTFRKRFTGNQAPDLYFASAQAEGPKKAIENLIESAWYTRHQASTMTVVYLLLIAGLLTLSIGALLVALREIGNPQLRDQVIRVVTAWLLLIVSLSMLKSAWSYFKMYQRCQKTELVCAHLLLTPATEADALKQWYEYQLARASSPLLPDWLWYLMGRSLDDAWQRASGRIP